MRYNGFAQHVLVYEGTKRLPDMFELDDIDRLYAALARLPRRHTLNAQDTTDSFLVARNQMILLCSYYLALRPLEAVRLRFIDFFPTGTFRKVKIYGANNKNRKDRVIMVPKVLQNALEGYAVAHKSILGGCMYLFPSLGKKHTHVSRPRWNDIFQAAIKEAGLWRPHPTKPWRGLYTAYSLRHTRATHLCDISEGNTRAVANVLGHANISVTNVYLHATKYYEKYMEWLMNA